MDALRFILLFALLLVGPAAGAALVWRDVPPVQRHDPARAGGHGHARATALWLRDGEGAEVRTVFPTLEGRDETPKAGRLAVRPSGMDNYHLLVAWRSTDRLHETALRYVYLHGKPSGRSPSELTASTQAALEIVPDPLPREHWRYETGEAARFRLRFEGRPLAQARVNLASANGSLLEAVSDAEGRVQFRLPDDFPQVRPGRAANAPADFVLSVVHDAGGQRHRTSLSAAYHVNPAHWQSQAGGLAALGAGFLLGLAALRRVPA